MKRINDEYHKRNVLLCRIIWLQTVCNMFLYLILQVPLYVYIDVVCSVILVCLPLEIFNRLRKFTMYMPYIFGTSWMLSIVICNLFFSHYLDLRVLNPLSFLVSVAMIAQYPSMRPILYYGGLSIVVLNVFLLNGFVVGTTITQPMYFMNYFLIVMTGFLAVSSHMTQQYYRTAEQLNKETHSIKISMEGLWRKINEWGLQLQAPPSPGYSTTPLMSLEHDDLQDRLGVLIAESDRRMRTIQDKNATLEQYAEQIERLTLQEERNRLSRELHDQIGHAYTGMTMGLESIKYLYETSPEEAKAKTDHLLMLVQKSFEEVRSSIHQLAAEDAHVILSEQLKRLLDEFSQGTGVECTFHAEGEEPEVSVQIRHTLYRCLQEALTNAKRHGQARAATVNLRFEADRIVLHISDDGIGAANLQMGFGLKTMKERLSAVQGHLQVSGGTGRGVEIVCTIPFRRQYDTKEIRLVIADDQPLIRESLRLLLEREPDVDVAGTAADGPETLALCSDQRPNVVLLDMNMPGFNGVEITKKLKATLPETRIILLTTFDDLNYAAEAIHCGAEGYLLKSIHPKKLIDAVRLVYSGGTLISNEVARQLADQKRTNVEPAAKTAEAESRAMPRNHAMYGLTDREIEILTHLAGGYKYRAIADRMSFSENTIRNYISIIYSKLGVDNRTMAIEKARQEGYLASR